MCVFCVWQDNLIVLPSAEFVIGNNLPPGYELGFVNLASACPWDEGQTALPRSCYFINLCHGTTTWEMPPDVLEQCNVTRLSQYPRCLPDHGLWASLKLWSIYYSYHSTDDKAELYVHAPPLEPGFLASPPYWCAVGACNAHNGRTSSVLDLTILASKLIPSTVDSSLLNTVFLPAMKAALSRNAFFNGIIMSTPTREQLPRKQFAALMSNAQTSTGILKLLKTVVPRMVELNLGVPSPQAVGSASSADVSRVLAVRVWSGQSMPKKDLMGKIDTFVEMSLVSGSTDALAVKKGTSQVKTQVIKSNYHPDYHHVQHLGSVPIMMMPLAQHDAASTRLVGVVQDWNTVTASDLVGNIEAPVPAAGAETETWYQVKDAKGTVIKGRDKNESVVYVKQAWFDAASHMMGFTVPDAPAGKLVSVDISWRDDLTPNVLQYILHHAGMLKILKAAGVSTRDTLPNMSVVGEAIIDGKYFHSRAHARALS